MDGEELAEAEAHIARLEQQLLRLQDEKRTLKTVQAEYQSLRRSVPGRFAALLNKSWGRFKPRVPEEKTPYERWLEQHRTSGRDAQSALAFSYSPLISVLMPTWNSNQRWLEAALESLRAQVYQAWELIIADDGSDDAALSSVLKNWQRRDKRIRILWTGEHRGISAALNAALAQAGGEWIALLDHDDLLEPDALWRVAELLQNDREVDLVYSDEDKIVDGKFAAPMLKPDWSPEFFLTHDYLGHLVVMRSDLARAGFRSEFDGAQDYDLLLRVTEKTTRIRHIPRVLYHWRRTPDSTAHNIRRKPGALEAGRRALQEHLARTGGEGRVSIDWDTHGYRVRRRPGARCISVFPIRGDFTQVRVHTDMDGLELSLENTGEWLLFVDCALEPVQAHWLKDLAEQLANPGVGAAGAHILRADGTVETAGYVLQAEGKVLPAFAGLQPDEPGVNRQRMMVRNYSAVSGCCLLTRRDDLAPHGDAASFCERLRADPICAAVEYCLQLRKTGLRVVSVPYAQLRRARDEGGTAVSSCPELARRWPRAFEHDPYYNSNLNQQRADFSLA